MKRTVMASPSSTHAIFLADLNEDQYAAVTSPERLVVVSACPGSGKTRTFVAAVVQEIAHPRYGRGGIAALSFTNAAEDEITRRLGSGSPALTYPHFVGTIDAFLLRYVVRVFGGRWVNLRAFSHPTGAMDYGSQDDTIMLVSSSGKSYGQRLAQFSLIRSLDGQWQVYDPDSSAITEAELRERICNAKKAAWKRGQVTYDDVAFLAATLLAKEEVRRTVVHRFPVLLVDEFQDTGGSRETALVTLLGDPELTHGLVVGDPDQCIMQFAGARPDLLGDLCKLQGAAPHPLPTTYRFPQQVADVAIHLAHPQTILRTCQQVSAGYHARTLLYIHDHTPRQKDCTDLVEAFARFSDWFDLPVTATPTMLAWKDTTVQMLRGQGRTTELDFECTWVKLFFAALVLLEQGDAAGAYGKVERVLGMLMAFPGCVPTDAALEAKGITRWEWKQVVWQLTLAVQPQDSESLNQWVARLREELKEWCTSRGADQSLVSHRIRASSKLKKQYGTAEIADLVRTRRVPAAPSLSVEKVHQAKGREFPVVCYYVPAQPASVQSAWFGDSSEEAARVGYVPMTRSQEGLMVALPRVWYEELQTFNRGKQFVSAFDVIEDSQAGAALLVREPLGEVPGMVTA